MNKDVDKNEADPIAKSEEEREIQKKLKHVWSGMRQRCYNPNSGDYKNYGGRGIYVCDRWKDDFQNFYDDMHAGYEQGLQLDRRNNDGPYSPENCRWVTPRENNRNKRSNLFITTALGRKTITEQSEITGLSVAGIKSRLDKGMPEELSIIPNPNVKGKKRFDPDILRRLLAKSPQNQDDSNGDNEQYKEDEGVGEVVWLDDNQSKMVNDALTMAELQAKAIKQWEFGPKEVILASDQKKSEEQEE